MSITIKYGNYTFGSSSNVEAWGENGNTRLNIGTLPTRHGGWVNEPTTLDVKRINISGVIHKTTQDAIQTELRALTKALNEPNADKTMEKTLKFWDNWFVKAVKETFSFEIIPGTTGLALEYDIGFVCLDPFTYRDTVEKISKTLEASNITAIDTCNVITGWTLFGFADTIGTILETTTTQRLDTTSNALTFEAPTGTEEKASSSAHRARTSNVATIGTVLVHGLMVGDLVTISSMTVSTYDVEDAVVLSVPDSTHFTYANSGSDEGETADTAGSITRSSVSFGMYKTETPIGPLARITGAADAGTNTTTIIDAGKFASGANIGDRVWNVTRGLASKVSNVDSANQITISPAIAGQTTGDTYEVGGRYIGVYVYIKTVDIISALSSIAIRIGQDSSNYKQYAITELKTGWNHISFEIIDNPDATTVGSPSFAGTSYYTAIVFNCTETLNELLADDIIIQYIYYCGGTGRVLIDSCETTTPGLIFVPPPANWSNYTGTYLYRTGSAYEGSYCYGLVRMGTSNGYLWGTGRSISSTNLAGSKFCVAIKLTSNAKSKIGGIWIQLSSAGGWVAKCFPASSLKADVWEILTLNCVTDNIDYVSSGGTIDFGAITSIVINGNAVYKTLGWTSTDFKIDYLHYETKFGNGALGVEVENLSDSLVYPTYRILAKNAFSTGWGLKNYVTGKSIIINVALSINDYVEIDTQALTVKKNGTSIIGSVATTSTLGLWLESGGNFMGIINTASPLGQLQVTFKPRYY